MKKLFTSISALVLITMYSPIFASAQTDEYRTTSPGLTTADGLHQIIDGGETQSDDPSGYNYVPEDTDASGSLIRPLSASGYQPINGFSFTFRGNTFHVTTGELQHRIIGSGNYIQSEGSQYRVPSTICDWRVDYQNRTGSRIHRTFVGSKHIGCSFGAAADTGPQNVYVQSGSKQCARLFVADQYRGEQCHNIG